MIKKSLRIASIAFFMLIPLCVASAAISFSGGYTRVNLQEGNKSVTLSGGANVSTDKVQITSDSIELYGTDYRYVSCTGNVQANESSRGITLKSPSIFYDRTTEILTADGWIEIQDTKNQAALSGAWFRYDMKSSVMKLQMMAKVLKVTDDGLMVCHADSIEFDNDKQSLTLKGNANVSWNGDTYKASMIIVNLETNEISLHGSISGEVNV